MAAKTNLIGVINATTNKIINGDSITIMKTLPAGSVDLILCDLPYGTTACTWDKRIPMTELWEKYKRIIKDNGAILLFAQQPFATDLINAGRTFFRHEIVWEKSRATGFLNANKMPLRAHELILVFYKKLPTYNPQFSLGAAYTSKNKGRATNIYRPVERTTTVNTGTRYPRDVIRYNIAAEDGYYHPTQKPLALLRYLIKTYSNEGDFVLDNCCGSGSTCLAAKQTGRQWLGIELDVGYHKIAAERCK